MLRCFLLDIVLDWFDSPSDEQVPVGDDYAIPMAMRVATNGSIVIKTAALPFL